MGRDWIAKAELFELLSMALRFTDWELTEVLVTGEYADALAEACGGVGLLNDVTSEAIEQLAAYKGRNNEEVFRDIRCEYTRLFVGVDGPVVSPYAGVHYAEGIGVTPALFVNREAMAVERLARDCGLARPEGTNEPLDHIATELEFLEYLCLDRAGVVNSEGGVVPADAYENFYEERFAPYARHIAGLVTESTGEPLFLAASAIIAALPDKSL